MSGHMLASWHMPLALSLSKGGVTPDFHHGLLAEDDAPEAADACVGRHGRVRLPSCADERVSDAFDAHQVQAYPRSVKQAGRAEGPG
jgi:hypothetical protein